MKNLKKVSLPQKAKQVAIATTLAVLSVPVMAAEGSGLESLGTTVSTELNKTIPAINAVGMAILSVAVLIKCYSLVKTMLGR